MRIPGVAVYDVGAGDEPGHAHVAQQRFEEPGMARIRRREVRARLDPVHAQPVPFFALVPEAVHVHLVRSPVYCKEFPHEILDMNTRAPVNVRGYSFVRMAMRMGWGVGVTGQAVSLSSSS